MARTALPSPKRYARVLLELAQARNALGEWRGILQEMSIAVSSDQLVVLLENPGAPEEEKQRTVRAVLPGATELGYSLLGLLARRRALRLLPRIQGEFEAAADVLEGLQRVSSFLGLAVCLILVSLFYQRFVFKKDDEEPEPSA